MMTSETELVNHSDPLSGSTVYARTHARNVDMRQTVHYRSLNPKRSTGMRANLSPAEEAQHLARRKELWEAIQTNLENFSKFEGRGNKGFTSDASEKLGRTQRSINQHIARAEALGDDINSKRKRQ